jgi:Protein of unknown function (DUF4231)
MSAETPSKNNGKPNRLNLLFNIKKFFQPQTFQLYEVNTQHKPSISDYLQLRFKPQVEWYEKNALSSMQKFYFCQIIIVIAGATIPIINVFGIAGITNDIGIRIWSSILGGTITILTGFIHLTKAHENWILYRSTVESLKREYQLFSLDAGEYSDERDFEIKGKLFIRRVESTIAAEGTKYLASHKSNNQKQ